MEKSDGASFVPGNEGEIFYLTWLTKKNFTLFMVLYIRGSVVHRRLWMGAVSGMENQNEKIQRIHHT